MIWLCFCFVFFLFCLTSKDFLVALAGGEPVLGGAALCCGLSVCSFCYHCLSHLLGGARLRCVSSLPQARDIFSSPLRSSLAIFVRSITFRGIFVSLVNNLFCHFSFLSLSFVFSLVQCTCWVAGVRILCLSCLSYPVSIIRCHVISLSFPYQESPPHKRFLVGCSSPFT